MLLLCVQTTFSLKLKHNCHFVHKKDNNVETLQGFFSKFIFRG